MITLGHLREIARQHGIAALYFAVSGACFLTGVAIAVGLAKVIRDEIAWRAP